MQSLRDCCCFFGNARNGIAGLRCIFTIFIVLAGQNAFAGAWPTPKGEGQIISTALIDSAKRAFDDEGKSSLPVQFSKSEASVYWEHGLSKDTTLVLSTNFQDLTFRAGADDVRFSGLGDTTIGLRKAIMQRENSVLSLQVSVVFAVPGETVSDAELGFGSTNFEGRVLAGQSFKLAGKDAFVDVQAAWRLRPNGVPDEWSVDATLGWRPGSNFLVLGQSFYASGDSASGVARENTRLKLQTSIVYDRSKARSFQIGFFKTVAGRNIIQEEAFFVSVWQRY